eukprot:6179114-Pleurochrysis_carterae.AAC.1
MVLEDVVGFEQAGAVLGREHASLTRRHTRRKGRVRRRCGRRGACVLLRGSRRGRRRWREGGSNIGRTRGWAEKGAEEVERASRCVQSRSGLRGETGEGWGCQGCGMDEALVLRTRRRRRSRARARSGGGGAAVASAPASRGGS